MDEQLKILIETFLMVNYSRSRDRLEGRNSDCVFTIKTAPKRYAMIRKRI